MDLNRIATITADELLDSRGLPTLEVTAVTRGGTTGSAMVPSGRSTGQFEAVELRDGDLGRFGGKGVLKAMEHVKGEICSALLGMPIDNQSAVDRTMVDLDGSESKARLGANAILGVSVACARAAANLHGLPLYRYLGGAGARLLPVPMFNVLNGGKHASHGTDVQEFKLVPAGASSFREAVRYGVETYHALGDVLRDMNLPTNVGDEGGYAPGLPSNAAAMDAIMLAIERAGYRPGEDIFIGLDPAATSFYTNDAYRLTCDKLTLSTKEMIAYWKAWTNKYPLISLEDPLAESDWPGFATITAELGDALQIVGDDLFVTNPRMLARGIRENCCNSILIKPNQIGTLSEVFETVRMANRAGYTCLVSHRSGETEDAFIADLAVALSTGQIKSGAPARGERVEKYNRLMRIERELGHDAIYPGMAAFTVRAMFCTPSAKPHQGGNS